MIFVTDERTNVTDERTNVTDERASTYVFVPVHLLVDVGADDGGLAGPERCLIDIGDMAREVVGLLQREVTNTGVTLSLDASAATPKVLGVRDHLHQVLLNLVLNAIQATPENGSVEVSVCPSPDSPKDSVLLIVEDSGRGIPAEILGKIFDPFFTTKDVDRGTGLGLALSHGIVERHGGRIEVESTVGVGTVFAVVLRAGEDAVPNT